MILPSGTSHSRLPSEVLFLVNIDPRLLPTHLLVPSVFFAGVAVILALTDLDQRIALAWAYSAQLGGFPARSAPWANLWLHSGGRVLVLVIGCSAAVGWAFAVVFPRLGIARWRSEMGFCVMGIALTTMTIGSLKQVTNVDCPWDLAVFGGKLPYLGIYRPRPIELPHAACFPGAHSGSGFALFCLYFALRDRYRSVALWALAAALSVGALFSISQEARGAHFLSHDLWSAYLAWIVCLGAYLAHIRLFEARQRASNGHESPCSANVPLRPGTELEQWWTAASSADAEKRTDPAMT